MQQQLQKTSPGALSGFSRRVKRFWGLTALGSALLLGSGQAQAQTANTYNFVASSGTFTPLPATATATPTLLADGALTASIPFPSGFTFNFEGVTYSSFRASSDGYISFGTSTSNSGSNTLSTSTTARRPLLAPLWDDLDGRATGGSKASYEVTGTPGSQVFTFEWLNWEFNYASTAPVLSFQVKLYEADGKIEYIYRSESGNVNNGSASIGIAGAAASDYISLTSTSTFPAVSTTTSFNSINTKPATGQVYSFTKPVATDISAVALVTPTLPSCFGPNQTVTIRVRNSGTAALDFSTNPLTVSASATGANPTTFTPVTVNTGTLAPGATQDVVISTTYDMSATGAYNFEVSATVTGDGFTANDAMPTQTITNIAGLTTLQAVDFTGFNGSNLATVFPGWYEASGPRPLPTGTTSNWTNDDYANVSANGVSAKINIYSTNRRDWMVGPKILANANTVLRYDLALTDYGSTDATTMGSDDSLHVMISTNCGASFTPLRSYTAANTISNTGQSELVSLGTYAGQNIIIAFYATSGSTNDTQDNDLFIDNILLGTPPANDLGATAFLTPATSGCYGAAEPVEVTIENFGVNPVNFATSPATVSVKVTGAATQTLSMVVNTGTLAAGATQNVVVGNLNMTAAGTYNLKGYTTISGDNLGNNDTTQTSRMAYPLVVLPDTVDFTGFTGSNLTTVFPNWREGAGATSPTGTSSLWGNSTALGTTTAKVNLYTNNREEWIVGPKVAPTATTALRFKAAITNYNSGAADPDGMQGTDDKVQVMVSTDCGNTFTSVYTFDASNTANLTNELTDQLIPLGAYAGQEIMVAFFATDGPVNDSPDYDFHIDDIIIGNVPAVDLGVLALSSPVEITGCYGTTQPAAILVKNFGSAPIDFATTNATVTLNVTGTAGAPQNLTVTLNDNSLNNGTPLAVFGTLTIPVGNLNMSALGSYIINGNVSITSDGDITNNTLTADTITVSAPVAGTAAISGNVICQSGTPDLSVTGFSGGDIQWQSAASATGPFSNIAGATTATFTPATAITTDTYYRAIVACGSLSDTTNVVSATVNNPLLSGTSGDTICGPGVATLTATPSTGASVKWYTDPTGGSPVATTNTYSPNVTTTTTFYAAASVGGVTENVGIVNGGTGTFITSSTGWGLRFTANDVATINSVNVYANGTGTITIKITDLSDNVLHTAQPFTITGATTSQKLLVPVNLTVAPGDYKMTMSYTGITTLVRESGGVSFPYTSPSGAVSITAGANGTNLAQTTGAYYWFYDWSISTGCESARTAVVAIVNAIPTVNLGPDVALCGATSTTLDAGNAGATFAWSLNGAPIAGATSQTLTATTSGTYVVSVTDAGCAATDTVVVSLNALPATPTITASGATTICDGDSVVLTGASATTGVSYQWLRNGAAVSGATAATYNALTSGNYAVIAIGTGGCADTSAVTAITVNPKPATPTITQGGVGNRDLTSSAATGNQWLLNGSPIAGATSATYTATANGNYAVVVTDNGCSSDTSAIVNITNTGIKGDLAGMSVAVYPNPNNGQFSVKLIGYNHDAALELYSLTGQLIVKETAKAGKQITPMQVKNLAAGTYLLKVVSEKGVQISKLIVE